MIFLKNADALALAIPACAGMMQQKTRRNGGFKTVFNENWIYSGDDLLFRGLSQSTIGDTEFPCLVRDGTEGDFRSIITRINPANIIITYF